MNDALFLSFLRRLFANGPSDNLAMLIEQTIYEMGHGEPRALLTSAEWSDTMLARFKLAITPDPAGG